MYGENLLKEALTEVPSRHWKEVRHRNQHWQITSNESILEKLIIK